MADLSILIPAYNEEETIVASIERALAAELPVGERELVVVENGSTDGTRGALRSREWPSEVRILELERNVGKGGAIRHALDAARGTNAAILDADLEYEASDIGSLLEPILAGDADAAIGTRVFHSHSAYGYWYVVGGRAVSTAANMLFNAWLSDILCCHKVAPTALLRQLDLRANGFTIDAEIPARLLRGGKRIYEVPVSYAARSREAGKKVTVADGVRILATLIRCRFDRWSLAQAHE